MRTGRLARLGDRAVDRAVLLAALGAFLLRLPGLTRPVRPDEAGFTIVARSWDPAPDSVYGQYFVDRPPSLIAAFRATDLLGNPGAMRLLGAVAGAATVLLLARAAQMIAGRIAARWCAVLVAALVASPLIDPISTKGELLALPFMALAMWCALLAVRGTGPTVWYAAAAGAAGASALGFKQNLLGGLVFTVVLLVASWMTGDLSRRRAAGSLLAAGAGASLPVLATLAWAVLAGVEPGTLWYAVYGFRADAAPVLATDAEGAAYERLRELLAVSLLGGIAAALGGFVVHMRHEWREDRPATAAVAGLLAVELVGLFAGGSYWRDYLFPLVPGIGLVAALLARRRTRRGVTMRWVVALAVASTLLSFVAWLGLEVADRIPAGGVATGAAISEAAAPGDTITVFGGRSDIVFESGLAAPYEHLWSLPMRTLDPRYDDLRSLVAGPEAPTWLVEWVGFGTWNESGGQALERMVEQRYVLHDRGCYGKRVYLLRGVERPPLEPDCP